MNGLTVTVAIFGLITSTIAILTALIKVVNVVNTLKVDLKEANWRIKTLEERVDTRHHALEEKIDNKHDALELFINGVKEKQEHRSERIQLYVEKNASVIEDLEAFLQKTTAYDRRSGR